MKPQQKTMQMLKKPIRKKLYEGGEAEEGNSYMSTIIN